MVEVLVIHGGQQLDGDQHLVAWLGVVEELYLLQVVTQRDTPPVKVEDLRHGSIGVGTEAEADIDAGQVVAMQVAGHFDGAAVPDGVLACRALRLYGLPRTVVQRRRFAMRDIARVELPWTFRQSLQRLQAAQHQLCSG